jgi:hypothetical protein
MSPDHPTAFVWGPHPLSQAVVQAGYALVSLAEWPDGLEQVDVLVVEVGSVEASWLLGWSWAAGIPAFAHTKEALPLLLSPQPVFAAASIPRLAWALREFRSVAGSSADFDALATVVARLKAREWEAGQ